MILPKNGTDYSRLGKPMTWPDDARPEVIAEARAIAENLQ
jgi:hypothetical protein